MAERDFPRHIDFDRLPERFNFPALFRERFQSLPSSYCNFDPILSEVGIDRIINESPITAYRVSDGVEKSHYFLWTPSGEDTMRIAGFIHARVNQTFERFLTHEAIATDLKPYVSLFLVEDAKKRLYLITEGDAATKLVQGDFGIKDRERIWDEVCEVYGIEKIISVRPRRTQVVRDGVEYTHSEDFAEVIIDYIEERREMAYLTEIALNHGMTYSQFLRFKLLAEAHVSAASRVNFELIAQEIVEEG